MFNTERLINDVIFVILIILCLRQCIIIFDATGVGMFGDYNPWILLTALLYVGFIISGNLIDIKKILKDNKDSKQNQVDN